MPPRSDGVGGDLRFGMFVTDAGLVATNVGVADDRYVGKRLRRPPLCSSEVTRVVRLAFLSPKVIEAILAWKQRPSTRAALTAGDAARVLGHPGANDVTATALSTAVPG